MKERSWTMKKITTKTNKQTKNTTRSPQKTKTTTSNTYIFYLGQNLSVGRCVSFPITLVPVWKQFATWWRHQIKTFSVLLAFCEGNPSVTGGFPQHHTTHKGQWTNDWANYRDAGVLIRHRAHYIVFVMRFEFRRNILYCDSPCRLHRTPIQSLCVFLSSWKFQELLWTKGMSTQKVKVRGQMSRSERSKQILPQFGLFRTMTSIWIHRWLRNDAHSLK